MYDHYNRKYNSFLNLSTLSQPFGIYLDVLIFSRLYSFLKNVSMNLTDHVWLCMTNLLNIHLLSIIFKKTTTLTQCRCHRLCTMLLFVWFQYHAKVLKSSPDLMKEHPLVDYTPPSYITLLFTDLGVLTPSAVSDELIKLYC